ncbi:MAG: hypothetical protein ABI467_19495 [Kofleriaceae bacterium]
MARILAVALVAGAGIAHADPARQGAAEAKQGRALIRAHAYAEACPKLEASQRLAPSLVTEAELAACDVHIGKLASALAAYRDVIAREPNTRHRKAAVDLVAKLELRVPRIIVNVEADAEVMLDGVPLAATAQGAPVDFGRHAIDVTKPGRAPFHKSVAITDEGQLVTINAKLADAASEGAPVLAHANQPPAAGTPRASPRAEPASPRRTYAVAMIGVGGAGLVTGIVFGTLARAKWNAAKVACGGSTTCATQAEADAAGRLGAQAHTRATWSTIFSIAGGAVAAAGIVIYATARDDRGLQVSALPTSDGGTFVVSGQF